ncbi:PEP-CTERM sorting domain-containing protein [Nitrosomonas sp.]
MLLNWWIFLPSRCPDKLDHSTVVPEPGIFAVLGIGLVSMGFARRRKANY